MKTLEFYGYVFLALGLIIRLAIGARKFNRRGIGGLQNFDNYFIGILVTFLEWLFNISAILLIILGLLTIIIS